MYYIIIQPRVCASDIAVFNQTETCRRSIKVTIWMYETQPTLAGMTTNDFGLCSTGNCNTLYLTWRGLKPRDDSTLGIPGQHVHTIEVDLMQQRRVKSMPDFTCRVHSLDPIPPRRQKHEGNPPPPPTKKRDKKNTTDSIIPLQDSNKVGSAIRPVTQRVHCRQ